MEKKMQNDMDTVDIHIYLGYKNEGFPKLVVTCLVPLQ